MSCNMRLLIKCLGLITAFTAGSVSCFSAPTTARVINHDVVAIPLEKSEIVSTIESDFLIEGGQTVFVDGDFKEMVVPITIAGENLSNERSLKGTIQAITSDEDLLQVSLDKNQVTFQDGKCVVELTMKRLEPQPVPEEPTVEPEEPTPDPEPEEPVPGEPAPEPEEPVPGEPTPEPEPEELVPGEPTPEPEPEELVPGEPTPEPEPGEPVPGEPTPEPGTEETIPEQTPEENLFLEEQNESVVNVLPQLFLGTTGTEIEMEQIESEEESEEPASEPEEKKETENEEEKILTSEVTLKYGEITYSAIIVLMDDAVSEVYSGNLSFCQSQFDSAKQITIIGDDKQKCVVGEFPPMTRYILDGKSYMLYNGGNIVIPAGKEVKVDFSDTELKENLIIKDGSEKTYSLKYKEFPNISEIEFPKVIDENGIVLSKSMKWGNIQPTIKVEHLVMVDHAPVWKEEATIKIEENEKNELMIKPEQAEAGTYRMIVLWNEKEVTLESREIPFFVQYRSVDQGGSGQ